MGQTAFFRACLASTIKDVRNEKRCQSLFFQRVSENGVSKIPCSLATARQPCGIAAVAGFVIAPSFSANN